MEKQDSKQDIIFPRCEPLEQRKDKNDNIWSISKLILRLPPFFTARIGGKLKANLSFDQMESFLYCLSSSKKIR